ncbi:nucleotidyltransferase domain-containing protein [Planococcus shenhongbingii]|uniref:Nucleotidyltransferase domain-containing protein n=1 Tax=Planococcus shenhongbingii TaxID=3058398 RepID=A0ABT8N807_9BACL|nr:nucleotidyltransferase domain-containing protein [Planococcus sp. N017]MDN7244007.1 nucleotidyltransferase domain-containing protein [Planococcus sp. N017]
MEHDALATAKQLVTRLFPDCEAALLAGSIVRGEATETSDLDLVVFDNNIMSSYRKSLMENGWPVEIFVHSLTSYQAYFDSDCQRGRPSLPNMVAEGIVLKDNGMIESIKHEARLLLQKGPAEWSAKEAEQKRYFLTDVLEDFLGCSNRAEELFIANALAEQLSEFVLRVNRQWTGSSKWMVRALKRYDDEFAGRFIEAFESYYRTAEKEEVIQLTDAVLNKHGGRLFDGFTIGKESREQ